MQNQQLGFPVLTALSMKSLDALIVERSLQSTNAHNVILKALIKMAQVIVNLKIMPKGTDVDLDKIKEQASHLIKEFGGEVGKADIVPVAFGLNSLQLLFVMKEELGSTEQLEKDIATIKDVSSAEVVDVRRAIG